MTTLNMIYLGNVGNLALADNKGDLNGATFNNLTEASVNFEGTFSSSGIEQVHEQDEFGSAAPDNTMSYALANGRVSEATGINETLVYSVIAYNADGEHYHLSGALVQATNGDIFIKPHGGTDPANGTWSAINGPIEKLQLVDVQEDIDYVLLDESMPVGITDTVGAVVDSAAVDGENFGEVMTPGYNDDNAPTDGFGQIIDGSDGVNDVILGNGGNDTINAGLGNDMVSGGSGDDFIEGDAGHDTLYGDKSQAAAGDRTRESFEWDKLSDAQIDGSAVQDTGNISVTYTRIEDTGHHDSRAGTEHLNTAGINSGGETIDTHSSLYSETGGQGSKGAFQWQFSEPVEDVSFNVNDIDGDGLVKITAYDLNGNAIPVSLEAGPCLTLRDTDSVAGADTADSNGGYDATNTANYNLQVTIPGPVSRIVLEHDQDGFHNSGISVTDIYYDAVTGIVDTFATGDDTIDGGSGDDVIYGDTGGASTGQFTGPRESFEWDHLSEHEADFSAVQDTGDVTVTYTRTADTGAHHTTIDHHTHLNVSGIDDGIEQIDTTSSLSSETAGAGNIGAFQWEFSEPVGNLEFNVNDLDGDGKVTILAYDPDGNQIKVQLVAGSDISVNGNTATAIGSYQEVNDPDINLQVTIPGPVSRITLEHTQVGQDNSGIKITDMYYDTGYVADDTDSDGGDDVIDGGAGNDTIFGEGGNDTIDGGTGNDVIYGDHGDVGQSDVIGQTATGINLHHGVVRPGSETADSVIYDNVATLEDGSAISARLVLVAKTSSALTVDLAASGDSDVLLGGGPGVDGETATLRLEFFDTVTGQPVTINSHFVVGDIDARANGEDATFNLDEITGYGTTANSNIVFTQVGNQVVADGTVMSAGGADQFNPNNNFGVTFEGRSDLTFELKAGDSDSGFNFPGSTVGFVFSAEGTTRSFVGTTGEEGDDVIDGGDGSDRIFGEGGNDTIDGGTGDDVIYGDNGKAPIESQDATPVRLNFDQCSDQTPNGVTYNNVATLDDGTQVNARLILVGKSDPSLCVDLAVSPEAAILLNGNNNAASDGDSATFRLDFFDQDGNPVTLNSSLVVGDIDGRDAGEWATFNLDQITGYGTGANSNIVVMTTGTTVTGRGTEPTDADQFDPDDRFGVTFEGQNSLTFTLTSGATNSGFNFPAVNPGTLDITPVARPQADAEGGDDVIIGGDGADQMFGEGGNDTFRVSSAEEGAGDVITGGNGPDQSTDHDVLDLRGAGQVFIDQADDATDEGATAGTVTFEDGSTLEFSQIEEVLTDPVAVAPNAMDDTVIIDEDSGPVTINVLANDTDPQNDPLTVVGATVPSDQGTVQIVGNEVVFSPAPDFNGEATITYTVEDPEGNADTAQVAVTVEPVNDMPVLLDDTASTPEDTPVTIDVLANDTDPDGDPLTVTEANSPNGTVTINPDGTITFTPDPDFNGETTITYTVDDGNGGTDTGTVQIDVAPIDELVAVDDTADTDEDTSVVIDVIANDENPDGGDPTIISAMVPAEQGTVEIVDNELVFTPAPDFNGEATITYTVEDEDGLTDIAEVAVTVAPVNDAPDAVNDMDTADEDTPITLDVLDNDADVDGDPLIVTGATVPAEHGTVEVVDNQVIFTPAENFNGLATISYSISDGKGGTDTAIHEVNVQPVNDAPVAVDDLASTEEDTPIVIDLIGNDTDVDGDPLTIGTVTVPPEQGTVVDNGDGTVTFTPAPDYTGPAAITYTVQDDQGGEDSGAATVNVFIDGVNDGPDAVDDAVSTDEDTPVTIDVLSNDADPEDDPLTISGAAVPVEQGTVEIVDNTLVFTPAPNFNGEATIIYAITDGNGGTDTADVIVTVTPVNDDPVAVDDIETTDEDEPVTIDLIANDTDVDGDPLTINSVTVPADQGTVVDNGDGTVTFTPAPNFNGPATITYTVVDGQGGEDEGQAVVSVGALNDSPVANDDTDTTVEDTPITVDLTGNDTDPDGDPLSIISATVPEEQGTLVNNGDGTVTFTPAPDFNGEATISYEISDGNGGTDRAEHVITVTPEEDAPIAADDTASTPEDTPVTIDVLANDTDPDGDPLTVTEANSPNGTVTINPDGTITFTPDPDFNGETTITYTVDDGKGGEDTAKVTVSVGEVNDAPDAVGDSAQTNNLTPIDIAVLANDTDPDGDTLTVTEATVDEGEVTINPDGTIRYTPDPDFGGEATITYTVTDGNGGFDTTTVTVNVADGIVEGTAEDDLMDVDYAGDPEGDVIDGEDAFLPGEAAQDDIIEAGDGNDTVLAGDGDDEVYGEDGDDILRGQGGDDVLIGGLGNDTIDGNEGDDDLEGNEGNDVMSGGAGNDTIDAGDGNDSVVGGSGDDVIDLGQGDDMVVAGSGDDVVTGGAGDDTVTTNDGNDTVLGGSGADVIDTSGHRPAPDLGYPGLFPADTTPTFGGPEDDRDLVDGGAGDDIITTGDDADTIFGGTGNDTIDGGIDRDLISGDDGNDRIVGGEGSDTIHGGDGNDTIYAGIDPDLGLPDNLDIADVDGDLVPDNGQDVVNGGNGNDTIFGADDDDVLSGDAGDDFIDGGVDDDTISGGTGNDWLIGGQGADVLSGDDDRDTFIVDIAEDGFGDVIDGGTGSTAANDVDDYDVLDLTGAGPLRIVDETVDPDGNSTSGRVEFLDSPGGDVIGTLDFAEVEQVIPCFTPGTEIATTRGATRVEDLRPGDRVITRDNGFQEVAWVGRKEMTGQDFVARPDLKPVFVKAGSLGNNLPERDMMLSPNHKLLLTGAGPEMYFQDSEVLVAAKHLVGRPGISTVEVNHTSYIHFMFENHEVVLSDGAWTESFHPGDYSINGIDEDARDEILSLFPELATEAGLQGYRQARISLKKHEANLLFR